MFFLHIWDVRLAVYGLDGSVEKMEIPKNVSGFLFSLDSIEFPMLSDLSFDDYGFFGDDQLEGLMGELVSASVLTSDFSDFLCDMANFIFWLRKWI